MARRSDGPGRVTPKGTHRAGDAHRTPGSQHSLSEVPPSPKWVPISIVAFLAAGSVVIFDNYITTLLPGTPGNGVLLIGLGLVLVGILIATQYR